MGAIDLSSFLWPDAEQRRQPQSANLVDRSVGFIPEVVFSGASPAFDLANQKPFTLNSANRRIGADGSAITLGSTANVVTRSGLSESIEGEFSFVCVIRKTANNAYYNLFGTSSTNASYQVGDTTGTGTLFGISKGGMATLTGVSIPNNETLIIVGSHKVSTGEYYVLCKSLTTGNISRVSGTETQYPTASNGTFVLNRNASPNNFAGDVYLCTFGYKFISESLGRNLLDNPWQILAAPSIPLFATAAGGTTDALTASSIITSPATVGSPLLSQKHTLSASSIISASTLVGTPTIGQHHSLTASSLASSSTVGAPSVSQRHVLAASGIAASATVAQPVITQRHALTASAISASATVGAPTLIEIAAGILSALPIVSAPAIVGAPAITQKHALTAGAISAGPATFGTPTLAQQHALMAQGISARTPDVGSPALSPGGSVVGEIPVTTHYLHSPILCYVTHHSHISRRVTLKSFIN